MIGPAPHSFFDPCRSGAPSARPSAASTSFWPGGEEKKASVPAGKPLAAQFDKHRRRRVAPSAAFALLPFGRARHLAAVAAGKGKCARKRKESENSGS